MKLEVVCPLSVSGPKYWRNILQIKCSELKGDRLAPVYVNVALMHLSNEGVCQFECEKLKLNEVS